MKSLIVRNKNVILELIDLDLIDSVHILKNLKLDVKSRQIIKNAKKRSVQIIFEKSISKMPKRRSDLGREVIYAKASPQNLFNFDELLDYIYQKDETPFFLLLNKVDIDLNISVLLRLAHATGVNGVFIDDELEKIFNNELLHISLGALLKVPIVNMKLYDAISKIKKESIKLIALDMAGSPLFKSELKGPLAILLGSEKEGLNKELLSKVDEVLALPMRKDAESLNVSNSASAAIYEKLRQESELSDSFNSVKLR